MTAERVVEQLEKGFFDGEDKVSEKGRIPVRLDHHPDFAPYFIPGDSHHEAVHAEKVARRKSLSGYRKRQVMRVVWCWLAIALFIGLVPLAMKTGITVVPEEHVNAVVEGSQEAWDFASTKVRKAFDLEVAVEGDPQARVLPGTQEIARIQGLFMENPQEGTAGERLGQAWDALLLGTSQGQQRARELLEQGVALDPEHPGVLAALSLAYVLGPGADPARASGAVDLLQRAQELDGSDPGVLRAESGVALVNKAYIQANDRARNCLKQLGGDGLCSWILGEALLGLELYPDAVTVLLEAERALPDAPAVLVALSEGLLTTFQYALAREKIEALTAKGDVSEGLWLRARLSREIGDFDEALAWTTRAVAQDAAPIEARLLHGELLLYHQGEAAQAFQVLSLLAETEDMPPEVGVRVLIQASNAARAFGEFEDALALGLRAVSMRPGWGPAHLAAVLAHESLEDLEAADGVLKDIDPFSMSGREAARVHYRTAMYFVAQDRQGRAQDELHQALNADPSYVPVRLALAGIDLRLNNLRQGLGRITNLSTLDLERELGRDPVTLSWYLPPEVGPLQHLLQEILGGDVRLEVQLPRIMGVLYAVECVASGQCKNARSALEQALVLDAGDLVALSLLGRIALQEENYSEAMNHLNRAASRLGNKATIQRLRAETLVGMGQLETAEEVFKVALNQDSEDPGVLQAYAVMLYADHRDAEARVHLDNVARLDPTSWIPRRMLLENDGP